MKYTLVLQGQNEIVITQEQRDQIEKHWIAKDGSVIRLGNDTIDTRQIKGIFFVKDKDFSQQNIKSTENSTKYDEYLESKSKLDPEQKSINDMKFRIVPGWKLSGGKREDKEMMDIYKTILEFYYQNKHYPYCPAGVWWPIISEKIQKKGYASMYFRYVFLQDGAIQDWLKKNNKNVYNQIMNN